MSGLAMVFERRASAEPGAGEALVREPLTRMASAMAHRAVDGVAARRVGSAGLAHLAFFTTPEERVPGSALSGGRLALAFDGRLDNRDELRRALGLRGTFEDIDDAGLVRLAFERWGGACFDRLLGPFAVAAFDADSQTAVLACDPLGGRCLYFALSPRSLLAASEAGGVLAHPAVEEAIDLPRLATYFTSRHLPDGATFYRGVRQLLPGEVLTVTAGSVRCRRIVIEPAPAQLAGSDDELAERFRSVLDESVRCRLRTAAGQSGPAILMSGGLDSTAIAACASEASTTGPPPTISWVLESDPRGDERRYLDAMYRRHRLRPLQIRCDDLGPLGERASWPVHPDTPEQNAFRRFHEHSFAAAAAGGSRVLLSGMLGDHLYAGAERWIYDLLRRVRLGTALYESLGLLRRQWSGPGAAMRSLASAAVPRGLRERWRRNDGYAYLTPLARRMVGDRPAWPPEHLDAYRPTQYLGLVGAIQAHGFSVESWYSHRRAVECRYPLRDRRLVELALRLPTEQLFARGVRRPILRRAMAGLVPDEILARTDKASFEWVFHRGMVSSAEWVRELLEGPDRAWTEFVQPEAVEPARGNSAADPRAALLLWLCVCFELWRRTVRKRAVGRLAIDWRA